MRCNKCGAASRVAYTSEQPETFSTRRRRVCDNGHRFTTHEVHETLVLAAAASKRASRIAGFLRDVRMYARDLRIWQGRVLHKEKYTVLAETHGIAESGARRIVHKMNKERAKQQLGPAKGKDDTR